VARTALSVSWETPFAPGNRGITWQIEPTDFDIFLQRVEITFPEGALFLGANIAPSGSFGQTVFWEPQIRINRGQAWQVSTTVAVLAQPGTGLSFVVDVDGRIFVGGVPGDRFVDSFIWTIPVESGPVPPECGLLGPCPAEGMTVCDPTHPARWWRCEGGCWRWREQFTCPSGCVCQMGAGGATCVGSSPVCQRPDVGCLIGSCQTSGCRVPSPTVPEEWWECRFGCWVVAGRCPPGTRAVAIFPCGVDCRSPCFPAGMNCDRPPGCRACSPTVPEEWWECREGCWVVAGRCARGQRCQQRATCETTCVMEPSPTGMALLPLAVIGLGLVGGAMLLLRAAPQEATT
jgi:hypothetical protein